ncbi:unnamed protein product [Acanthoscelides obtectus]|nr:unnamed protein product [Acanthoscelides obtectus]CAK1642145.1 Xaa-Pro aminopeptidase 1 [Acanthoscelides obtectus]
MQAKPTTNLLKQLRALMKDPQYVSEPINAYIVPSEDAHFSEYIAPCDEYRAFISGFNGSWGTALITEKEALLWTDGRYYQQASMQMDSNWMLMKEGVPEIPNLSEWLAKNLPPGSKVGLDPRRYDFNHYSALNTCLENADKKIVFVNKNLIEVIWKDRPFRPENPVIPLPYETTGSTVKDKFLLVNEQMKEKHAKHLVVSALDEVAYFLNLRGSDIEYNPVFFAYLIISTDTFTLFINQKQISDNVTKHLSSEFEGQYVIKDYEEIDNHLNALANEKDGLVWFAGSSNVALVTSIPKKNRVITDFTPICMMKAIKNPVESRGMRNAHIKDAAALCCYFAWLDKNVGKMKITEISGATKLREFRKMQKDFVGDSFATISSVGAHGAIIHYQPQPSTDVEIVVDQMYLCDSGGQYRDGTTDVTRTLYFGIPTKFQKDCYTRVLKGQLKLGRLIFPRKLLCNHLDSFARQFLWQSGLDYAHGTGHGVGAFLNVHEGPIRMSWRPIPADPGLEAGMFISNEPGYYQEGEFGMRIEDIMEVVNAQTPHNFSDRGFLTFETVTLVPKMKKLIEVDMLTDEDIECLNRYHATCRKVIAPLLDELAQPEAKAWLIRETEPLRR